VVALPVEPLLAVLRTSLDGRVSHIIHVEVEEALEGVVDVAVGVVIDALMLLCIH
jgi:hypothetical protein